MNEHIDYVGLLAQKEQLIKQLRNLSAKQFGATSLGEMNEISRKRKDINEALEAINKKLQP